MWKQTVYDCGEVIGEMEGEGRWKDGEWKNIKNVWCPFGWQSNWKKFSELVYTFWRWERDEEELKYLLEYAGGWLLRFKCENRLKYTGTQNEVRKIEILKLKILETKNMGMKYTGSHLKHIFWIVKHIWIEFEIRGHHTVPHSPPHLWCGWRPHAGEGRRPCWATTARHWGGAAAGFNLV